MTTVRSETPDILKYGVTQEAHEASEERCSKCEYRGYGESICDYLAITGKPRILVSPEIGGECKAFRPKSGTMVRKSASMTIRPNAGERPEELELRRRQQIYRQMRALYDEGLNDREIAEELRKSATTVRHWRIREGLPSNTGRVRTSPAAVQERQRQMVALWKQGLNDREIAEKMQMSKKTVRNWRKLRGLKSNYDGGKTHADE